ncbi:MAG: hypothetical protein QOD75_1010 [Blastocatellia bacterium]|jgi:hypothetical protein|nr:hypothetical protein [Blastocatellia bacterium]
MTRNNSQDSKRDAAAVKLFLTEEKENLAARAVREVENKLATVLKNPKLSASKR